MARTQPTLTPQDLELRLLRKGVGELAAGRHECADCGRTPLFGERVHHYDRGKVVCDLCRPTRRRAPAHSELVHHSEHGLAVKPLARAA